MFLEKENIYPKLQIWNPPARSILGVSESPRNWSYKKEKEKNVRNVLGERKHLPKPQTWNSPARSIPGVSESPRNWSYKKEKEKNVRNILRERKYLP